MRNRKELKAFSFANEVGKWIKQSPNCIVELCAGNGNVSAKFVGCAKYFLVDKKKCNDLDITLETLGNKAVFVQEDLLKAQFPTPSLIIAVHACGQLTDLVLDKAVQHQCPVAVMPCCYNQHMRKYSLKEPPDNRKLAYKNEKNYYDAFRLRFLQEQGYSAVIQTIDERITPMNNILMGSPTHRGFSCSSSFP